MTIHHMIHIKMTLRTFTGNFKYGHRQEEKDSWNKEIENYRKTIFFFISFIKITVFIKAQKCKMGRSEGLLLRLFDW